jgi:hypothetical protein
MLVILEQLVEWSVAGETAVLGEKLPQRHFVHHKPKHDQTRARTRAATMGSQRLTAWTMARPLHWGRFSSSTSVSPTNSHSTNCSTLILGYYNSPNSGRRTKWTLSQPTRRNQKKTTVTPITTLVFRRVGKYKSVSVMRVDTAWC